MLNEVSPVGCCHPKENHSGLSQSFEKSCILLSRPILIKGRSKDGQEPEAESGHHTGISGKSSNEAFQLLVWALLQTS